MRGVVVIAAFAALCVGGVSRASSLVAEVDGVKGSEWSSADVIGTLNAGTNHETKVYAMQDSTYLYVGYEYLGTSAGRNFDGVNHYVDSFQGGGTYGDGDDVIVEGGNYHWAFGLDGSSTGVWESTPTNFAALGTGRFGDAAAGVYEGYLPGGNFAEFAVKKSLVNLGSYSTIEIGGQAWNFDFDFVEISPASIRAVPLPASALAGLALFPAMAAYRRLRRK